MLIYFLTAKYHDFIQHYNWQKNQRLQGIQAVIPKTMTEIVVFGPLKRIIIKDLLRKKVKRDEICAVMHVGEKIVSEIKAKLYGKRKYKL